MATTVEHMQRLGPSEAHLEAARARAKLLSEIPYGVSIPPELGGVRPPEAASSAGESIYDRLPTRMPTVNERVAPLHPDIQEAHRRARERSPAHELLEEARRLATEGARRHTPEDIEQYLNPHQQHVMDRIRNVHMRTLNEHLLPQLRSSFIKAGHRGGESLKRAEERLFAKVSDQILEHQGLAAHSGYQAALEAAHKGSARQLESSRILEALGIAKQGLKASEIAALREAGKTEQEIEQIKMDLRNELYARMQRHPLEMLQFYNGIISGHHYTPSTYTSTVTPRPPSSLRSREWGQLGLQGAATAFDIWRGLRRDAAQATLQDTLIEKLLGKLS